MNNTKTTKEVLDRLNITEEMINYCRDNAPNNSCIECSCTEEDCLSVFLIPRLEGDDYMKLVTNPLAQYRTEALEEELLRRKKNDTRRI